MSEAPFHPLNPQHFRDPYPHLARARKECPVGEFEPGLFYMANDRAVREVLRTPTDFSSQGNFGLQESDDPPVVTQVDGEQHTRLRTMLEQRMKEGNRVFVGLASANRDETVWDDPDHFSLDRPKGADHLAFGFGQHFCLGSALARSEAHLVLEILCERVPQLRLAEGFHYEPQGGAIHRGPKQLLVCWS